MSSETRQTVELDIERDFPADCVYVDVLLSRALRRGRASRLLRNQMVVFAADVAMGPANDRYLYDPAAICQTIEVLEGKGGRDITKGPSRFTKGPLRGLEYKHFFQASFMAQNLLNESRKAGPGAIYRKLIRRHGSYAAVDGRRLTQEDLGLITEAFVTDSFERRAAQRAKGPRWGLTGEHLVFARTADGMRYLFVAPHTSAEAELVASARACIADFPALKDVAPGIA
ncbi:hypothetical protein [uncultured Brevundimonas sp.]|uniref:hypothetical protein n=1 Tax=uncultured Brevundimonas sp. TaxID=213418 RepID=UPI0030EF6823|tara:strand:- start:13767 stop:14450 length:684 start_codon:yes stop_codon:yes gene_type:complete